VGNDGSPTNPVPLLYKTLREPGSKLRTASHREVRYKAKSPKLPKVLTVSWVVEAVAWLGAYLEHRRKTPIGIQVLWRGWLKLHDLCKA
jgi:hypothetical protein